MSATSTSLRWMPESPWELKALNGLSSMSLGRFGIHVAAPSELRVGDAPQPDEGLEERHPPVIVAHHVEEACVRGEAGVQDVRDGIADEGLGHEMIAAVSGAVPHDRMVQMGDAPFEIRFYGKNRFFRMSVRPIFFR